MEPLHRRPFAGRADVGKSAIEFLAPDRILERSRLQIGRSRTKVPPLGFLFSVNHCECGHLSLVPVTLLHTPTIRFAFSGSAILRQALEFAGVPEGNRTPDP